MRLASRVLAGSLIIVMALVAAIVLIAGGRLRNRLVVETTDALSRVARLVATQWREGIDADSLARVDGAALGYRVTLIDRTGVVVGDAAFRPDARRQLENHATRPEVIAAQRSGIGSARRQSTSAGDEELFVAVRHRLGYVRASITTRRLEDVVTGAQRDVLASGLVAMAGALLMALFFARTVSRPVVELRDVARAIAGGDLSRRPALSAPGEIGDLATALHRMTEQFANRLASLQKDDLLMIALIEALEEGVLALDERGTVVRINERARVLLNVLVPLPFPMEHLPRERVVRAAIEDALGGQATAPQEMTLFDRTVTVSARPLPTGAVITMLDLTVLRRLETIRRDFVANVSHELKTPLTAVSGFAETLLDDTIPSGQRHRFIETIRDNARRMQRIVDELLDLSRIESGGWRPQIAAVDVLGVVTDILAALQPSAHAKGLDLTANIAPDAAVVSADQTAFRQVVTNLVENAVRYTKDGSVALHTRLGDGGGVWVDVRDTGVGIGVDHLPRIFERFYRVDAGRSREQGGTGLGLAIVRHLMEAHGGRVEAASVLGRGTTISAFFPSPRTD